MRRRKVGRAIMDAAVGLDLPPADCHSNPYWPYDRIAQLGPLRDLAHRLRLPQARELDAMHIRLRLQA